MRRLRIASRLLEQGLLNQLADELASAAGVLQAAGLLPKRRMSDLADGLASNACSLQTGLRNGLVNDLRETSPALPAHCMDKGLLPVSTPLGCSLQASPPWHAVGLPHDA